MRRSLRLRLTIAVVAVTAPLMAVFALLLYRTVAGAVWDGFDRQLQDDARVMADLIEFDEDGLDFETTPIVARFSGDAGAPTDYAMWGAEGDLLIGDGSIFEDHAQIEGESEQPTGWEGESSGGEPARFVGFRFFPQIDEDEVGSDAVAPSITLVLGRETGRVDRLLEDLAAWFWMLGTGMVLVSSAVAGVAIRTGLRPMTEVSETLSTIDETRLNQSIALRGVPIELQPLVERINQLLARLDTAFDRERRFSADVAHELRTPLTVLRTGIELAGPEHRLAELGSTVEEMVKLIDDLLELSRSEVGALTVDEQAIDVRDLVEQEWDRVSAQARERNLELRNRIPRATYVETDPTKLRRICANLLSNAVAYTEPGGWIEIDSRPDEGLILSVSDSGPPIPLEHLPHLFERFWRADTARTSGGHAGLGLALVRTSAELMGLRVRVEHEGRLVRFLVEHDASR